MSGWSHSPTHRFNEKGTYMVTAGTFYKRHFFKSKESLYSLQTTLLELAKQYGLSAEAWAVFSNHYHVVLLAEEAPVDIKDFVRHLHSLTAREANAADATPGRKVWFQYRDTHLATQKEYYARMNYVMENAVRHGLVKLAKEYEWCSASWFLANSTPSHYKTVTSFPVERQAIHDPFEPIQPE